MRVFWQQIGKKLIPRKINLTIYLPKISEMVQKATTKNGFVNFQKFRNSQKVIPQNFRKWQIRENQFRERLIPQKLIPLR